MKGIANGDGLRLGLCLGIRAHKFRVLLNEKRTTQSQNIGNLWDGLSWARESRSNCGPSIVVADQFGRLGIVAMISAKYGRSALVFRLRGDFFREEKDRYLTSPGWRRYVTYRLRVLFVRFLLRQADGVLFNSQHTGSAFAGKLRRNTITGVVYNPYVPLSQPTAELRVPEASKGLKLLTITNFGLWAKVEPLFVTIGEWLDRELATELDLVWLICGDKYYVNGLRDLIRNRGLENYVKCVGFVPNIKAYYEWCDVLVHLSGMDAFPNVTMEAMDEGKPILTNPSSCGTLEQVIDEYNGVIVHGKASFVSALRAYSNNSRLRRQHGENGRCLLHDRFMIEAQRTVLNQFFETLLHAYA